MFEDLKSKVAHFIIKKKYMRKDKELIAFKTAISGAKDVLILMPDNEIDFTNSINIIRYFKIQQKDVFLFVSEKKQQLIPNRHEYRYISFLSTQITRFFLPDKMLRTRLKERHFDLVIDLNREESTFFSCVGVIVQANLRIGFRKNRSDAYYNLLFESKQNEPSAAYSKFLEHLEMF